MAITLTASMAIEASMAAVQKYVDLVVDHDPDDGDHVVPGELRRFLGRLRLLHGVPFSYLIPDVALLPKESIRFFYIDRAWTDAMVQGVLSVGTITTADRTQLEAVYPHIRDDVDAAERTIRQPHEEALLDGAGGTITGFLLRSKAVSGWPNMHVRAYRKDTVDDAALTTVAESHPDRMKLLRIERLAPAVLLVLIDGVPEVVHIEEPRQGIQFGVRYDDDAPGGEDRAKIKVRDCLTGDSVPPLEDFTDQNSVVVPFRPNAPGVINMARLRDRLFQKAPNVQEGLQSNEFALQVLRFPYRQVFGDPDDREGGKFYDMDQFKVTISLGAWRDTIALHVGGGA